MRFTCMNKTNGFQQGLMLEGRRRPSRKISQFFWVFIVPDQRGRDGLCWASAARSRSRDEVRREPSGAMDRSHAGSFFTHQASRFTPAVPPPPAHAPKKQTKEQRSAAVDAGGVAQLVGQAGVVLGIDGNVLADQE